MSSLPKLFLDCQLTNVCFLLLRVLFSIWNRMASLDINYKNVQYLSANIYRTVRIDVQFIVFSRRWQKYVRKEYWMIHRGPGGLSPCRMTWLTPPLPLPSLHSASCLSFSVFLWVAYRAYWWERGKGGRAGYKSYDSEKAWSSINHSILSAFCMSAYSA